MSAKIKKTDATAVKAKTAKAITSMKQLDEALAAPEIVTTATKKAEAKVAKAQKPPKARKTPVEDLVVFAFRLTQAERDAIHKAAGPANASKFIRALAIAAANRDEAQVGLILKGVMSTES